MIDLLSIANLLAWSIQVLCVIAIGAVLPRVLRLDVPGVRYAYWRALLALSLMLPILQPRHVVHSVLTVRTSSVVAPDTVAATDPAALSFLSGLNWPSVLAIVILGGAALRMVWIAAGLFRLRRLRTDGQVVACLAEFDELQRLVGTTAEIRYVTGIKHPVTFGVRNPVVLLPDALRSHSVEVRRAVLAHELFHVQRRDWAWVLLEECIRAIFWFNPAVWWIVSAVQASREEVVDELALLVARRRTTYVEALLAFADPTPLAPAPAFARRRHLLRRITLISKEGSMSSRRIVASCAVMALVILAGSWYATSAFPLQQASPGQAVSSNAPGALEARAKPVTPENPVPRRISMVPPEYPPEAAALAVRGTVTVRVTLDAAGQPAEVRLFGLALRSDDPNAGFNLTFSNIGPADLERFMGQAQVDPGRTAAVNAAVLALIRSAQDAVRQWRYYAPFDPPISFNITLNFAPAGTSGAAAAPPPPPPPPPPGMGEGLRVGGNIKAPEKIVDVKPVYPPAALDAKVQGVVIVEVRIDESGVVTDARVLRSIPLLDEAALDAVKQWQFRPTLLNGKPVPVFMTATVNFTLQQ